MFLFKVEERFMLTGVGLVLASGPRDKKVSVNDKIRIVRPDGSTIESIITGISFNLNCDIAIGNNLTIDDVPIGSEVWLNKAGNNFSDSMMMQEKPTVGLRLASMLIDHFAMTFLIVMSIMIIAAPLIIAGNSISAELNTIGGLLSAFISMTIFSFYFNKDVFNGQSIAKRIIKLQVRDYATGEIASPLQCLVRNITIVIWPVEVLVTFFNSSRRLGDRLAGTMVVTNEEKLKRSTNWKRVLVAGIAGLAFMFVLLIVIIFCQLLPGIGLAN